ncbi:hypothetical protein [Roseivirga misakiensis]|uniref:Beta-carotene 15,15'-monooxygenase n=1 Tax=Roseivirga misakiensis TaxID=1563681 RepID=A0A1E5T6Q9_9BACT|nr:hypothetical protein [Roseivirga misakiensis]OEK07050.1 hypothetical protein BFP71_05175 [Roseivirga misakiensis]
MLEGLDYLAFNAGTSGSINAFFVHSGPLSELTFVGLESTGSPLLSLVLATVLILFNSILLNSIFIRNASFEESSFLPAAVMTILMSASPNFFFLSPALIGSSFIIFSLNNLFYHVKYKGSEENILGTGFSVGIAGLFFYPYFWFYPLIVIIYIFYSSTLTRRYFLLTWGFVLPYIMTWVVYLFLEQGSEFSTSIFQQIVSAQVLGEGLNNGLMVFGFGLALSLIAAIQGFSGLGMTNHQIMVQKAMSWLGFFGVVLFAIFGDANLSGLMILVIPMSYFITKMLISINKKLLTELVFIALLGSAIATLFLIY